MVCCCRCLNTKYQIGISILTLAPLLVGAGMCPRTCPVYRLLKHIPVFSALRVHALQGRHYLLASSVFVLGIYPLFTNAVSIIRINVIQATYGRRSMRTARPRTTMSTIPYLDRRATKASQSPPPPISSEWHCSMQSYRIAYSVLTQL